MIPAMGMLHHSLCGLLLVAAGMPAADDTARAQPDAVPVAPPVVHERVYFRDHTFDVVTVDLARAEVMLLWKEPAEEVPIRGLRQLETYLKTQGLDLLFATNAGIYSKDFTPAGLHVEQGEEVRALNLREGGGNFHMKPNGVFYIDADGANVVDSEDYAARAPTPRVATQSGPLLVRAGELHPRFEQTSTSVHIRSGVGVVSPRQVVFAISHEPVNFHTFASLFQEPLQCSDALYLDGRISRFYLPGILEGAGPAWYVGLLAVVAKDAGDV
jgi:uncharacterized protein YigE (DUF2233 family)